MISFNLRCGEDHTFEAWFKDGAAYEKQATAGEVACPVCADTTVEKAPMAPRVAAGKAREGITVRQALTELRQHVEANCENVGDKFADEARKIHYGEAERRDIYGKASDEEAQALDDEDIEFSRLPVLPRTDS
jgi:hypothetical protein